MNYPKYCKAWNLWYYGIPKLCRSFGIKGRVHHTSNLAIEVDQLFGQLLGPLDYSYGGY